MEKNKFDSKVAKAEVKKEISKKINFTSKMANAEIEVTALINKDIGEKEENALKAFEVDDYMKGDIVKACLAGVSKGGDKTVIDGVKIQIEWEVI